MFSPSPLGRDRQQHRQQWVTVAPEGSATAPLAAAAALLMEHASSRRQELVSSVHKLHERAVALAVSDAVTDARDVVSGDGDGLTSPRPLAGLVPSHSSGGVDSVPPALSPLRRTGSLPFPIPAGVAADASGNGDDSDHVLTEGPPDEPSATSKVFGTGAARSSTHALNGKTQWRWDGDRPTTAAAAAAAPIAGGLAGVSCCLDFERILGDGVDARLPGRVAPLVINGGQEISGAGSFISREEMEADRGGPLSDSSVVAERSFSGVDQQSLGGMAGGPVLPSLREESRRGEVLPNTGGVHNPSFLSAGDEWATVFRDVAMAEEHCMELLEVWEAAGDALEDACEDF